MKNLLTCDINGRIYMSYASRQRYSKSRATQSSAHPPPRACATSRGCRTLGARVVGDQASSLSLSAACSATPATRPGTRRQGLLYGQAFAPSGGHAPDLRRLDRFDPERDRQPSRAGGTPSWGRPWLTTRGAGNARCGWNINLTGCGLKSWRRFMNAWYLTRCSSPCEPRPHCPGTIRRFGMTKVAAIYARVSSDRQKENHTITSQVAALRDYAQAHEYKVPAEELNRGGVELVFLNSPSGATPEDQLLLQFQGMIAEYERAQIAERSRRGK